MRVWCISACLWTNQERKILPFFCCTTAAVLRFLGIRMLRMFGAVLAVLQCLLRNFSFNEGL